MPIHDWNDHFLILDGAMGTLLQQRGLPPGKLPELFCLTHGDVVCDIHRSYLEAGSQVIYTNTFGANRLKLAGSGHSVAEVVSAAVKLARQAAGHSALVALDIGPLGELLEPMGSLRFEDAYDLFREIAQAGADAGADLAVIETLTDLYEAKAALLAVKENTALPAFVTMSFEQSGRTFTGCTIPSMARTLEGLGADAIGMNCSLGPDLMAPMLAELAQHTRLPVIAKPNAGLPDPVSGRHEMDPATFVQALLACQEAGATIFGGCCGTSPDEIRRLAAALKGRQPAPRQYDDASFLCTPTRALRLDGVHVIGERINPTGKPRLQQALLQNDLDYILSVALQQVDAGADLLDVNVGCPGVDEVQMLPRVVKKLQSVLDIPLQLDSSNPDALQAGLRVYNGKAAVNSVNGKAESLAQILPVVRKYGAAVVGLALDEGGICQTAQQRVAIAENILQAALQHGVAREDVWIDCLTLTVSAQQDQAEQTLRAVQEVRDRLGLQTVLGVSNVSFGLPNRPLLTQTFLAQALGRGLTLPILNPNQTEIMDTVAAFRVLSGEDRQCERYIARFAQHSPAPPSPTAESLDLGEAIARGQKVEAGRIARQMLQTVEELQLVERHLIPALDRVGEAYEQGRVFLPQLLSAAQAAQAVFEAVRTSIAGRSGTPVRRGRLIVATVQGDIHDIGKNIVKTVLENYGFDVTDLGRDVPPETVAQAVRDSGARLVGLSALMTTTLPAMAQTIQLLKTLPDPPHVFVGGAVLTPDYARRIGADSYAKDARQAVEIARKVLGR